MFLFTTFWQSDLVESVSGELDRLEMDSTLHGGSAAVADELIPENATDVYKNYKFRHNYTQLPVLEAHDTVSNIHAFCVCLA